MSKYIFLYEWRHFVRSPYKVGALILFIAAAVYGLHNGKALFDDQRAEIQKIGFTMEEDLQKTLAHFERGEKGPEDRPWVDLTDPFWAVWYTPTYSVKTPSPAMVYSLGQAEQFGFYKRVTTNSTPYDPDLTAEIANPERLQVGTLDFSFVVLYLMPLLLLVLLYNVKGDEAERGFLPLIYTQAGSRLSWLTARTAFYVVMVAGCIFVLTLYGAMLTGVFAEDTNAFGSIFLWLLLYLLFWSALYFLVFQSSESSVGSALKMAGLWILFGFAIPASVHQWTSIQKPVNLMVDFIDAQRDDRQELWNQPPDVLQAKLNELYPEIKGGAIMNDSTRREVAINRSAMGPANELTKERIAHIERENAARNRLIAASFWFNPVMFFQNKLNAVSGTHYQDYYDYRSTIQELIDKRLRNMILDIWHGVEVDKEKYLHYYYKLSEK